MLELLMERRLSFKQGAQRIILEKIQSCLPLKEMALVCRCSERTIRDWKREKFLADLAGGAAGWFQSYVLDLSTLSEFWGPVYRTIAPICIPNTASYRTHCAPYKTI